MYEEPLVITINTSGSVVNGCDLPYCVFTGYTGCPGYNPCPQNCGDMLLMCSIARVYYN
jgi:hypothetical protein